MKIDFYISSLSGGGAEKVLTSVANRMAQLGHDTSIISLEKRPQFYVPDERVKLVRIHNTGKLAPLKDYLAMRRRVRESRADLAVSFLSRCNLMLLLVCMFNRQKVIVSDRNNPLKEHSARVFAITNRIYRRADRVIVQTEAIRSCYDAALKDKLAVVENPIDTVALDSQIQEMPSREKVVLSMGRLEAQKDFDTLIRAFAGVHAEYPEWKLEIYGQGDMHDQLQSQIDALGLGEVCILCGRTSAPYLQMRRASIFVLSSFYEGFPNVLCEAMYAGDLCISSDCMSGPKELIDHDRNGWLFEIGDADTLKELICRCIREESTLAFVRDAAERTVERLHLDRNIDRWTEVFMEVLNS